MKEVLAIATALVALAGTVSAHQLNYTGTIDVLFFQEGGNGHILSSSCVDEPTDVYFGGVCYTAGHIPAVVPPNSPPGTPGQATVTVTDDASASTVVFYCQDVNGNSVCGETGEPEQEFCGQITLVVGATTWDPARDAFFFVAGAIGGQQVDPVLLNACGQTSIGTTGSADHQSP